MELYVWSFFYFPTVNIEFICMQLFSCFLRLFLQELGFQAGQHEIVAETLSNHLQQEVIKKSKEIVKKTKNNIKEAKKISENLNRSYKDLDKCKAKYQKSHNEMEEAKSSFLKADCEGTMSRNEISKLKHARKVFIMLNCYIYVL